MTATDDALRKETERLIKGYQLEGGVVCLHLRRLQSALDAQSAELKRLEGKAARYEWLRDADDLTPISSCGTKRRGDFIWIYSGAELDAAIDAAMKESKDEG